MVQGTKGREELLKLRREARDMALGADRQCLDRIGDAKDGDTIEVPKGRHYPRITQLADGVSLTQDFIHVKDPSQVRAWLRFQRVHRWCGLRVPEVVWCR